MVYFAFWQGCTYTYIYIRIGSRPRQGSALCAASSEEALRNVALVPQATEPGRNPFMD